MKRSSVSTSVQIKLSVCIFTYNHGNYIAEAIESVLQQVTDFEFEIVIGEDFSKDNTAEIVKQYQNKYPNRIRAIFNTENKGLMVNNRNTIRACRGDYIALLDGDDYWIESTKLQNQVDFLENNPAYSFCFHDGLILNSSGVMAETTCCQNIQGQTVLFNDIICDVSVPTFSIVFRRTALGDYPPPWFDQLNAPDRPLFLLLASAGPAYYFNKRWGVYRKHPNGTWTGQHYQSQWLTHLQIFRVLNKHFENRFKGPFSRCERRIAFILAKQLAEDAKFSKARCYFRKYIRMNTMASWAQPEVYYQIFKFLKLYMKKKYFKT